VINTGQPALKGIQMKQRGRKFPRNFYERVSEKYFYNAYLVDSLFSVLIRTIYTSFTTIQLLFHIVPAAVQSFVTWWEEFLSFLLIESMPFVVLHYIFFNPFNLTTILNQWLPGFSYSAGHK
jgi:hypothetical protein